MAFVDRIHLTRKITRARQRAFFEKNARPGKTLDIGCGNDLYGDLFPNRVTLDIRPRDGVRVDIVADAHNLSMIQNDTYDTVLCAEVLEHLHTPAQAIAEMFRVLKPGGVLLLTTRFIFPIHDAPNDFYRYTKYGLRHLLHSFDITELKEEAGTIETLAIIYQRLGFQCETLGWRPWKILWFLKAWLVRYCGFFITKEFGDIRHLYEEKDILASGYYVVARKPLGSSGAIS